MAKIAIDIVLIPSKDISEKMISMSHQLFDENRNDIVLLNPKTCIPHISLAMGCVEKEDLDKIAEKVKKISSKMFPLNLKFSEGYVFDEIFGLVIEKSLKIQELHEHIVNALNPYLKTATRGALYQNPKPTEKTIQWVMKYNDDCTFANFFPHLTIGQGELKNINLPIRFTTYDIAICHLGRYCTCRKILWKSKNN